MIAVKWVHSYQIGIARASDEDVAMVELSALQAMVEAAIDAEEELPGDIPQEMYDTIINGDKDVVAEALRAVVRVTKNSIKQRLLAQRVGVRP